MTLFFILTIKLFDECANLLDQCAYIFDQFFGDCLHSLYLYIKEVINTSKL